MDELNDFLNCSPSFQRVTIPGGYVNGRGVPKTEVSNNKSKREGRDDEYAEKYRNIEMYEMKKAADLELLFKQSKLEDLESEYDSTDEHGMNDDVYNRYQFDRVLPDLPIVEMKDLILKKIKENPVVVLEGVTGCGKSTQVPQFILDEGYDTGRQVNIIVTQPRRIAAVSIAHRVSEERKLPKLLPHLIGYQIGLNIKTCDATRITFCTTGVLLEKLIATKTITNYTHIILDEVHESSQNMDFLFIVIRKLRHNAPSTKIILMSATIEAAEFSDYFKFFKNEKLQLAPVIQVEKKSKYKISEFFLCDLKKLNVNHGQPDIVNPVIEDDMYLTAVKLIFVADRIDYTESEPPKLKPSILIFLPGIYEISCMLKKIEETTTKASHINDFVVVILHSEINHDEQMRSLRTPSDGKRMVILATNIAESSITVPDVKYVIDFCLTKSLVTDSTTNFTSLQMEWCSRSNCRQRAGRTGRTCHGRVYRLVPKDFYEHKMDDTSRPEMCRAPLETVILKAKQLNMGKPSAILSLAMDQPTLFDIENTILLLKESGALLRTCDGVYYDDDGDMTFIGHVMASLPVNFRVAKMIVLGHCFSVLSECIIIGAGLTTKSIFLQDMKNEVATYSKKLVWSDGSGSDLFAILKAYKAFETRKTRNGGETKNWANRYFLNEKSLNEMTNLIAEITERLNRLVIKERTGVNRAKWSPDEKSIILKVVITGAFYPTYFSRSSNETEDQQTFRTINGRNPLNTVYFSGFPEKFIRPLYVESIKKMLMPCTNSPDNIQVTFDEGNEKVFVTFRQTKASLEANLDPDLKCMEMGPGQVCIEVYKALKMKRSKQKQMVLRVLHPKDAVKYADQMKIGSWVNGKFESKKKSTKNIEMMCLPRKHVKELTGKITHYDTDLNRFWFRAAEEEKLFNEIQTELNALNRDIERFSSFGEVEIGQVAAAGYSDHYYRVKIVSSIRRTTSVFYNVLFIDVGVEGDVAFDNLWRLRGVSAKYIDVPGRVFECRLACLQPSELHVARYGWGSVMKGLRRLTAGKNVTAEIYSVENGVASVFIAADNNRSVQETLIDEGIARTADENFMSKVDHDLRVRTQSVKSSHFEDDCDAVADEMRRILPFEEECEVKEPDMSKRHNSIQLKGPKSPLESSIYSCLNTAKTQSKKVGIETHSVNSVLLQANPQDSFEKYVIAANVTETQNKTELCARETTIMPNIPGFGPLMALIFSPYCEFFRDRYKSRYAAIICGLGQHPKEKYPLYAEHDIVFNLDCEIDVDDIQDINMVRFSIDNLLRMQPDQKRPLCNDAEQNQSTQIIKKTIIKLLEKERPLTGIPYNIDIGWSKFDPKDVVKAKDLFGASAIFPFHNILSLAAEDSPERLAHVNSLVDNNELLYRTANMNVTLKRPIKCMLCHLDLETVSELKIHVYSRLHSDREKRISLHY